jgi:hypothetical protein
VTDQSVGARIAELEAEIAELRLRQDVADGMRSLNLTVEKARSRNEGPLEAAASTWSTACCIATFSSASSYCVAQEVAESDPELAQAFVILHRRAVEVMGDDGAADALIEQANNHEVVQVRPPAS